MKDNQAHEDLRNEDEGVLVTVGFFPGLIVDLIPLKRARVILYPSNRNIFTNMSAFI